MKIIEGHGSHGCHGSHSQSGHASDSYYACLIGYTYGFG